jgi:dolichol-phosphate mannosyltransferase
MSWDGEILNRESIYYHILSVCSREFRPDRISLSGNMIPYPRLLRRALKRKEYCGIAQGTGKIHSPMTQPERAPLDVSIIFPTYNEKDNIGPLIFETLKYAPPNAEIIVVDDNSPDGTWKVVEEIAKDVPNVLLLRRINKRGLTSALRDGIARSRGEIIVWSDCDFSMPPHKIKDLLEGIARGNDVVVGSRFVKGGGVQIVAGSNDTLLAYLMSLTLNSFIQRVLGREFKDYTSGFIAFRRAVLKNISLRGEYGEYFIDFIYRARKLGFKVAEIPYMCVERRTGVGKTGQKFTDFIGKGWKYVWLTIKLRFTRIKKNLRGPAG